MDSLKLFHGSPVVVEKPEFGKGNRNNDYGIGFYCTREYSLAGEWAYSESTDGFINKYELNLDNLSVLNLGDVQFHVLNWLAILLENRFVSLNSPIAESGRRYILENFLPAYKNHDLIVGYRADDSYFSFVRAFVNNTISLEQLGHAMKLGKLGTQYVLKSEAAFEAINFSGYDIANRSQYLRNKLNRDFTARSAFRKELEQNYTDGLFIRDILRERIGNEDERLR